MINKGTDRLGARGIRAYYSDTLDSTNREARRYAAGGGQAPALFAADGQTEGRGRLGRSFFSPSGTGIYMTLLLDITADQPASVVKLTSAAAVAVTDTLEACVGVSGQIKWVNDIYLSGRKVCGILAESFFAGERRFVAVGVGINLDTRDFPAELADVAGSLGVSADRERRRELTERIAAEIFDVYSRARGGDNGFMDRYRQRSLALGRRVVFTENGVCREGAALDVDDDGGLLVELDDGTAVTLSSGEITLRVK